MSEAAADYNMLVLQKQHEQVVHPKKAVLSRNNTESHFGDGHGDFADPHQDIDHLDHSMGIKADYGAEVLEHLGLSTLESAAHRQEDHFNHTMVANADYGSEVLDHLSTGNKRTAMFKAQDHMAVGCQPNEYNALGGTGRATTGSVTAAQKSHLVAGGGLVRQHTTELRQDRLQKGGRKTHENHNAAQGDHLWGVMSAEDKDAHNAPTSLSAPPHIDRHLRRLTECLYDANGNLAERTSLRDAEQANDNFRDHFGAGLLAPDAGGAGVEHQIWNSCGATRTGAHLGGQQSKYNQQRHFSFS